MTKRLFIGIITIEETIGRVQNINTEMFIDWASSREQALGAWFEKTREKYPAGRIAAHSCFDATDYAKEGVTNGAFA